MLRFLLLPLLPLLMLLLLLLLLPLPVATAATATAAAPAWFSSRRMVFGCTCCRVLPLLSVDWQQVAVLPFVHEFHMCIFVHPSIVDYRNRTDFWQLLKQAHKHIRASNDM